MMNDLVPIAEKDGPLSRRILALQASTIASTRERLHWEDALPIARVLDTKQGEIKTYMAGLPRSDSYNRVQVGPITVREARVAPTPNSGWQSVIYAWPDVFSLFKETCDLPMGASWVRLNRVFQNIIGKDEYRTLYGYCEGALLARKDIPILAEAFAAVDDCLKDVACTTPKYSAAASALIARQPFYAAFGSDRASLASLKEALHHDLAYRTPIANDTITVHTNGDLILPLDPGPFKEVTSQLEAYITTVWSTSNRRLRIQWVESSDENKAIWRIVSGDKVGRWAYVDRKSRTIGLFSDVTDTVIAHEFGHVLGFPDYYFTSYDAENCRYVEESNQTEIMSDDSTAVVPEEYWRTLEELYPLK